ncbi:AB hydrolase-1 domain-containing protein [Mycena venus]|uniref:AB hydrolase-1 domain-containing protein n=1 Tax=Mycena venus TaxID=2733690 RepID=A0A8H6XFL7_9AGAR|nr:AB hydrolase-1 domain-containing protein [Mycena venus]
MPTVSIPGKDIQFFFTDTGAPGTVPSYTTLILVHGHTYHSAVFQKLLPLAATRSVRIVCINRREYPGSTPHTAEELRVYASGSDQERTALMNEAGVNLALAIDEIIQQCNLPSAGVALAGWSLGNTFTMAAMGSILSLPSETQERLQTCVETIIMWDPPSHALGIASPPNAYVPLYDQELPPAARGPAFGRWVTSYYIHGDLSNHDPDQLNYRNADPSRKATYEDMPIGELLNIVDYSVGGKCDTILTEPPFASVVSALVNKALFDPEIRSAWKGTKVAYMYGTANPWNVHFGLWDVEGRLASAKGKAPIAFRPIENANHFVMWEDPSLTLDELIDCTKA